MNDTNYNVQWVNNLNLCHGCGACYAVCPVSAIEIVNTGWNNFPCINPAKCIKCNLCNKSCSGQFTGLSPDDLDLRFDKDFNVYLAYSTRPEVREKAASGGFITQYILDLLSMKEIDGAILAYSDGKIANTQAKIVFNTEEVKNCTNSKYIPVSSCKPLKEIDYSKKYAFVGKGCDINSLGLMEQNNPRLRDSIVIKIGLMCHHTPPLKSTADLMHTHGYEAESSEIIYRSEGWPGQTIIKKGENITTIDYKESWCKNLGKEMPYRCSLCTDSFAKYADLTVGDPWVFNKDLENQSRGVSLIATNTERGGQAISKIKDNFNIEIRKTDLQVLLESQPNLIYKHKKSGINLLKFILNDKNKIFNNDIRANSALKLLKHFFGALVSKVVSIIRNNGLRGCRNERKNLVNGNLP